MSECPSLEGPPLLVIHALAFAGNGGRSLICVIQFYTHPGIRMRPRDCDPRAPLCLWVRGG